MNGETAVLTHEMVIREVRLAAKREGKHDFGNTMPVAAVL